jgi:very-short-patch-repair endonuclease
MASRIVPSRATATASTSPRSGRSSRQNTGGGGTAVSALERARGMRAGALIEFCARHAIPVRPFHEQAAISSHTPEAKAKRSGHNHWTRRLGLAATEKLRLIQANAMADPEVRGRHTRSLASYQRENPSRHERQMMALLDSVGAVYQFQHPALTYILDFGFQDAMVAVELDGGRHSHPKRRAHDRKRDAALCAAGWTVLRVNAREVCRPVHLFAVLRYYVPDVQIPRGLYPAAKYTVLVRTPDNPDGRRV